MTVIIGIDPGRSGGLAAISTERIVVVPMLLAGKELDIARISEWLYEQATTDAYADPTKVSAIVCIEKVHAMVKLDKNGNVRREGVVSMFTFGKGVGILYGIVGSLMLPLYEVAPQTWKKQVLAGTQKDKLAAIDYCRRVYPEVCLLATPRSKKPHDGMADALCIARYALEKYKDVL